MSWPRWRFARRTRLEVSVRGGGVVRLAADGRRRRAAVPGDEHAARRRVSRRRAQLLALELHPRPAGRAHRDGGRAAPRAGLEPSDPVRVDRPTATGTNIRWTRETFAALQPRVATGRWLNYLGEDQADDAIQAAYGPNYRRLRDIKRRYDPETSSTSTTTSRLSGSRTRPLGGRQPGRGGHSRSRIA